jgi:hypothetical protein
MSNDTIAIPDSDVIIIFGVTILLVAILIYVMDITKTRVGQTRIEQKESEILYKSRLPLPPTPSKAEGPA